MNESSTLQKQNSELTKDNVMMDLKRWRIFPVRAGGVGVIRSGVILALLLVVWWQASEWYETRLLTEERADIQRHLIPYGNALTTGINQRFAQLEGLRAFARTHPTRHDLDTNFETFATGLYTGKKDIRAIQIFPHEGTIYVYPVSGNEAVLGRTLADLVNDERPDVRADVQRTIETRQITTSGPYELRQGGLGFLARLAVYRDETLWNIAVIILDMPPLLAEAGISMPPEGIELAVRDSNGQVFVGSDNTLASDPVTYQVDLPDSAWTMAMVPAGGWQAAISGSLVVFRIVGLVIVGLLSGFVYLTLTRQSRLAQSVQERTAALAESQIRYQTLFESNSDALFVLSAQGRIIDVNQSACYRYGYNRAELLTMTPTDLAAPDLRDKVPGRIADALAGQIRFEWQHQRKNGTEFPVEISAQSFVLDNQPVILSSVRDITERKRAEEALKLSEERLRMSTEMAGVAVWEYDWIANRMARSANHDQLYGLDWQEIWVIDTFLNATHPDDRELSNRIIQDAVAPGGPDHYGFDFRVVWPDQSVRWLAVTGEIAERDAQGNGTIVRGCLIVTGTP